MCPFPQLRVVGVRASCIYSSNISWTLWVLDPIANPYLGPSSWLHPVSIRALIWYDWCPYNMENFGKGGMMMWRHTGRRCPCAWSDASLISSNPQNLEEARRDFSPWAIKESMVLSIPWLQTCSLQNCGRINFSCFKSSRFWHFVRAT